MFIRRSEIFELGVLYCVSGLAAAGFSASQLSGCASPTKTTSSTKVPAVLYEIQNWGGLQCQVNHVQGTSTYKAQGTAYTAAPQMNMVQIGLHLEATEDEAYFRALGEPQVVELLDGYSEPIAGQIHISAFGKLSHEFLAGRQTQRFTISITQTPRMPKSISSIAIDVPVERATELRHHMLPLEMSGESVGLAPGIEVKLVSFERISSSSFAGTLEYETRAVGDHRPAVVHRVELLDAVGKVLRTKTEPVVDLSPEARIGSVRFTVPASQYSEGESASLRLLVFSGVERHTFRLQERDLRFVDPG